MYVIGIGLALCTVLCDMCFMPPPPPPPPQYESTYPAYPDTDHEEIPYAKPAKEVGDLYDQLAQEKCIEIPRSVLKWVLEHLVQ